MVQNLINGEAKMFDCRSFLTDCTEAVYINLQLHGVFEPEIELDASLQQELELKATIEICNT
jgi:hypothetical protein